MTYRGLPRVCIVILPVILYSSAVFAEDGCGFLDRETARRLALEAVRPHDPRGNTEMNDMPEGYAPPFFVFVADDFKLSGSFFIGHFAVNPWTGDVWSTGGNCHLLTNPGLQRMQNDIRRKYQRKAGKKWLGWKKMKPWCDAD